MMEIGTNQDTICSGETSFIANIGEGFGLLFRLDGFIGYK